MDKYDSLISLNKERKNLLDYKIELLKFKEDIERLNSCCIQVFKRKQKKYKFVPAVDDKSLDFETLAYFPEVELEIIKPHVEKRLLIIDKKIKELENEINEQLTK